MNIDPRARRGSASRREEQARRPSPSISPSSRSAVARVIRDAQKAAARPRERQHHRLPLFGGVLPQAPPVGPMVPNRHSNGAASPIGARFGLAAQGWQFPQTPPPAALDFYEVTDEELCLVGGSFGSVGSFGVKNEKGHG